MASEDHGFTLRDLHISIHLHHVRMVIYNTEREEKKVVSGRGRCAPSKTDTYLKNKILYLLKWKKKKRKNRLLWNLISSFSPSWETSVSQQRTFTTWSEVDYPNVDIRQPWNYRGDSVAAEFSSTVREQATLLPAAIIKINTAALTEDKHLC